jgi:hypothetical protein
MPCRQRTGSGPRPASATTGSSRFPTVYRCRKATVTSALYYPFALAGRSGDAVIDGALRSTLSTRFAVLVFPALSDTEAETMSPAAGVELETVMSSGRAPSSPDNESAQSKWTVAG